MMWDYYNNGSSWFWMGGTMVVFWGVVILLAVVAFRLIARRGADGDDAMMTLRKRFAAGEINQDEFEKSKRLLQG